MQDRKGGVRWQTFPAGLKWSTPLEKMLMKILKISCELQNVGLGSHFTHSCLLRLTHGSVVTTTLYLGCLIHWTLVATINRRPTPEHRSLPFPSPLRPSLPLDFLLSLASPPLKNTHHSPFFGNSACGLPAIPYSSSTMGDDCLFHMMLFDWTVYI